jgi:hypothetical protein
MVLVAQQSEHRLRGVVVTLDNFDALLEVRRLIVLLILQ